MRVVGSGVLDVSFASSITHLEISGGELKGTGNLTVSQTMAWTGGTLTGPGKTILDLASLMTINIATPATLARDLDNDGGTIQWQHGTVTFDSMPAETVVLRNLSLSQINVSGTAIAGVAAGGAGHILNEGTITVEPTGDFEIAHPTQFDNVDQLNVQTGGALLIATANGSNTGNFDLGPTATPSVTIAGGGYTFDGATVTGTGLLHIGAELNVLGEVVIEGFVLIFGASTDVNVSGTMSILNQATWWGGRLIGVGVIEIFSGAVMNIDQTVSKTLACTLDNFGQVNWLDGQIIMNAGPGTAGTLNNHPNAEIDISDGDDFVWIGGGISIVNNMGLLRKTGANDQTTTVTVGVEFNNSGQITVDNSGIILLTSDGVNTGLIQVNSHGPFFEVQSPAGYTFGAGASVDGFSEFIVSGVLIADADFSVSNLSLQGTVSGPGNVTVTSNFIWYSGTATGSGRFILNSNSAIQGGNLTLQRDVENHGDANHYGGSLTLQEVTWTNEVDGSFRADGGSTLGGNNGAVFNNLGQFVKVQANEYVVANSLQFDNAGTMTIFNGKLKILTTKGTVTGIIDIKTPGQLFAESNFALSQFSFASGASVVGTGSLWITGKLIVAGNVLFDVDTILFNGELTGGGIASFSEKFEWGGGSMTGAGTTKLEAGPTAQFDGGNKILRRSLEISRDVNWSEGQIHIENATMTIFPGRTFICDMGNGIVAISNAAVVNNGVFVKHASNTLNVTARFTNNGTIQVLNGELFLLGPFPNFSGMTLTGGKYEIEASFRFNNADIRTNAGNIKLKTETAQIVDHAGNDAFRNLGSISNIGSLDVCCGRMFTFNEPMQCDGGLSIDSMSQCDAASDFQFSPTGQLKCEIGETAGPLGGAVFSNGVLNATGEATVDGALVIDFAGGPVPPVGSSFDVIAANAINGTFDCVDGSALPTGVLDVTYGATTVTVSIVAGLTCANDTNNDGVIDVVELLTVLGDWGTCADACCAGDVSGDNDVDVTDLLTVLAEWGPCPDPCPVDLNGDFVIDVNDLLALLAGWGGPGGDVTGDGTTDVNDLLTLLAAWGPCF